MDDEGNVFQLLRITCRPRQWSSVAEQLVREARAPECGLEWYGIWRSQIGRPRDELTVIVSPAPEGIEPMSEWLSGHIDDIVEIECRSMRPTLRPLDSVAPTRQGNYAFRYFVTPEHHFEEFLELCAAAWPGFEAAYDSQVIGLWRFESAGAGDVQTLMLTRRPNLAMWERSKIPEGAGEAEVRAKLSRRYDLCDSTVVHTSTLLTATDAEDAVRWA